MKNPFPTRKKIRSTPTPTKAPTPTTRPTSTLTPTTLRSNSEGQAPTPYVFNNPASTTPLTSKLDPEYIFNKVNEHRKGISLPAFEKDEELCKLASSRAPEIYNEIYGSGSMHAGLRSRQIPYWINENIATYNSEDAMINWWLNDYIHKIAMEGNYKYSCVACSGISCSQLFTNYIPK
jgi:uncharacterized protein YkwD